MKSPSRSKPVPLARPCCVATSGVYTGLMGRACCVWRTPCRAARKSNQSKGRHYSSFPRRNGLSPPRALGFLFFVGTARVRPYGQGACPARLRLSPLDRRITSNACLAALKCIFVKLTDLS